MQQISHALWPEFIAKCCAKVNISLIYLSTNPRFSHFIHKKGEFMGETKKVRIIYKYIFVNLPFVQNKKQ